MKFFGFLAVAALSFSVVACDPAKAPVVSNTGNMAAIHNTDNSVEFVPAPEVVTIGIIDDKMMFAAETLYNIPAHAYVAADSRGQLSAETKAKVKPMLTELYAALQTARKAKAGYDVAMKLSDDFKAAGLSIDFRKAFETMTRVSGEASALLPKSK